MKGKHAFNLSLALQVCACKKKKEREREKRKQLMHSCRRTDASWWVWVVSTTVTVGFPKKKRRGFPIWKCPVGSVKHSPSPSPAYQYKNMNKCSFKTWKTYLVSVSYSLCTWISDHVSELKNYISHNLNLPLYFNFIDFFFNCYYRSNQLFVDNFDIFI